MKKLTLALATAATLAVMTVGVPAPAMAAPHPVGPGHDTVYSTDVHGATYQPVDCSVHVRYQGADVDVNWC